MRHFIILAVLILALSVLVYFGLNSIGLLPESASLQAETIDWLFDIEIMAISFLFSLIIVPLIYSLIVFRRKPGETGHKIPRSGLFKYVTSANYLGEIVEWCGWAIATWSLPGLAFAVWTSANLVPRARVHHRWYKRRFEDYPEKRRVIIPFVY